MDDCHLVRYPRSGTYSLIKGSTSYVLLTFFPFKYPLQISQSLPKFEVLLPLNSLLIAYISMYKLGDDLVASLSSNLNASLWSLSNGQCPPLGEVDDLRRETMAGINSRFVVVTVK